MVNPKYCVFLKSGLPARELEFISMFTFKVTSPQGEPLHYFRCKEIDVSHHNYIEMKIHHPEDGEIFPLMVPHHYILLIDGSERKNAIGYVSN